MFAPILTILCFLMTVSLPASALSYENLKVDYPNSPNIPKILVYTYTDGYRHDSIPTAIEALAKGKERWGVEFEFEFEEDKGRFTDEGLQWYDAIMFVSVTGEALDDEGEKAFQRYLQKGGNFIGVHAATVALPQSDMYKQSIGALFEWHPVLQDATFKKEGDSHPATAHIPNGWRFGEEVYYFTSDPRDNGAVVLLSVDENSYNNEGYQSSNGNPHPIGRFDDECIRWGVVIRVLVIKELEADKLPAAWYIDPPKTSQPLAEGISKGGRVFYTALGHSNETWQDDIFMEHVVSGLIWTLNGATTKAYNQGQVGCEDPRPPPPPPQTSTATTEGGERGAVASPTEPGGQVHLANSGTAMRIVESRGMDVSLCFVLGFLVGYYVIV
ncbi:hypothetical protein I316_00325 [Kwoniella heveanensis BCC8398]|uniref:ThuA-like domain-containing protein n=1 Tax=Kwoniella heveanensis BCC8398 TaxID=1296120 RepID=A0A1B9H4A7_9TREE|nr:hypothetical protein I316_00325 [Kwoniella heveanensis BCC8398]